MKKIDWKKIKLTREEQKIEDEIDQYVPVSPEEHARLAAMITAARKNAVLHIRINQNDLALLKSKAKRLGVKYQTFIAEVLHRVAHGHTLRGKGEPRR